MLLNGQWKGREKGKGEGNGVRPVGSAREAGALMALVFVFALRLSLCSLGFFAPHAFCGALPSEPNALADAVAA